MHLHIRRFVIYSSLASIFMVFAPLNNSGEERNIPNIPFSFKKRIQQPAWGDLNTLRKRRVIRVLISYNRTNFFITPKGPRGLEYDLLKAYGHYLNRGPLKKRYHTQMVFIPLPFKDILPSLYAGKGDIAAAGLTILPERKLRFDFTEPYIKHITEHLITNRYAPPIKSLADLSNKRILIVANSSYLIHLKQFNQALAQIGLKPIRIIQAAPSLEAEDILEMVNLGIADYTVVDSNIADIWRQILPNIKINPNIIIHYNGNIGWAINKNTPKLKASLNHFIHSYAKPGRFLGNSIYRKYFESTYWIKQPLTNDLLKKIPCLQYYFELYANYYGFDEYLIAAQAYQESRFNQNLISHKGAKGIMQIKPSTAAERYINIKHIDKLQNNIHAGVKYLAFIRDHFFSGKEYTHAERQNFALAAYNAGPTKIKRYQKYAAKAGLNPYKWFYNVETIARQHVGQETVNYVANIKKMAIFLNASQKLDLKKRLFLEQQKKQPPLSFANEPKQPK